MPSQTDEIVSKVKGFIGRDQQRQNLNIIIGLFFSLYEVMASCFDVEIAVLV
jgi:hypothetical protein